MSDPDEAARLRELQRRAFARPRTPEEEADALDAAAELAALSPAPTIPPSPPRPRAPLPDESEADDDSAERTAWGSVRAVIRAWLARLTPGERRGAAIAASALVLLTGILAVAHAALTAPPPALAVLDGRPIASEQESGDDDIPDVLLRTLLSERGVELDGEPHVFGEVSLDPRLVVYRQRVSTSITEICGAVLLDAGWLVGFTCTSEQSFRTAGLTGRYTEGSYGLDFEWRPDGTTSIELVVEQP